ncbi:MAG: PilZ domain-containing protein [Porphyrobacter sp.]|nr:PilZ domain-containing protein [Porphyrobacter sp.]
MNKAARQDVIASVTEDASSEFAEQRGAPRLRLLIRAAKLVSSEGEYLCVVRDASEGGVSVRLFHPLPTDAPLTLELQNGDRYPLLCVWEEEGKAGFRFENPADLERIVESPSRFAKRAVRMNISLPCVVRFGEREVNATLCNLSQQGGRIITPERLSLVQRIRIEAEGFPELAAKVRWRRGETYGLSFENNLQFEELARIAFDVQQNQKSPT